MREEAVTFMSEGHKLVGVLHIPDDVGPGERRPAMMVLHGFGSNHESSGCSIPARMLCDWGYVTFRFSFRGCGKSEGEFGRIICMEQVADTSSAVTFLQSRPEVDPDRIGTMGSSFGAAVSVYAGGVDKRIAAVISQGGWGDGVRKFKGQHKSPAEWAKFTAMLEEGKRHRATTGKSLMVPRYDIVPIPEHLRGNLAPGSVQMFPAETAQSMMDFVADNVVGNIAPRPLLLLHAANDSVTPTEQSIEMFKRAGQPTDLHLLAEVDHFMFGEKNVRVHSILRDWLSKFFPAKAAVPA